MAMADATELINHTVFIVEDGKLVHLDLTTDWYEDQCERLGAATLKTNDADGIAEAVGTILKAEWRQFRNKAKRDGRYIDPSAVLDELRKDGRNG